MNHDDAEIIAVARAGFVEEANEMLAAFEAALLTMETTPDDTEAINSAFRAAHTIKGTAGLFGFEAVVAFTHGVESVLEAMRAGELRATEDGIAVLLQSRDQIEGLLGELDSALPDPALAQRGLALSEQLAALRRAPAAAALPAASQGNVALPLSLPPAGDVSSEADALWHIVLRMGADALRNGLDPMSFMRYLATLGDIRGFHTDSARLPELVAIDAEACYLTFDVVLATKVDGSTIEQVFEFMRDDCELWLLPPDAGPTAYDAVLDDCCGSADERAERLAIWHRLGRATKGAGMPPRPAAAMSADAVDAVADPVEPTAATPKAPPATEPPAADRRATRDRRTEETRFIRVRADKLDALIDLIGELVIASSGAQLVAREARSPRFTEAALRINKLVEQARDGTLGLRMVPIGETFTRFQRIVRDVSKQLGKDVELEISGADAELDKSMVETIADPLMHLVRNSLDHGLESAEERVAAGKSATGRLGLHAYHESGGIVIEVSDDGRGLSRDRIYAKAVERGLVAADAVLDDDAIHQLIFSPGFSTAAQVTNLSGRGVGMDVVKRNVESLRGQIKVASQPGRGATIQIRLPLTLAIIDGFLTSVGGVSYVLPLDVVAECLELPAGCGTIDSAGGDGAVGCFDLRGQMLPYLDLRRCFGHDGPRPARQSLIVARTPTTHIGLLVDRLLGEYQTVIKPLGSIFQNLPGLVGSTILGSGEVALILDVPALEARQAAVVAALRAGTGPRHLESG